MEEKKINYRYSWAVAIGMIIFMLAYFVVFLVTNIELINTSGSSAITKGYSAVSWLLIVFFFISAISLLFSAILSKQNTRDAFAMNIVTLGVLISVSVIFSVYIALYGVLISSFFIAYLIAMGLTCVVFVIELGKNAQPLKGKDTKDPYEELNAKIAQLEKLKESGLIDENQYDELKKNYVSKFLMNEKR